MHSLELLFSGLVENLKATRGLSEDSADSVLHRLIGRLSEVASSSSEAGGRMSAMAASAARCLGEIGPCDLHTLVLQPAEAVRARAKNPFQDYAGRMAEMVLAYLGRPSALSRDFIPFQVSRAQCEALLTSLIWDHH